MIGQPEFKDVSASSCRKNLLQYSAIALVLAFVMPSTANAQATSDRDVDNNSSTESRIEKSEADIVVTGSRVVRNGYKAPTPVTVLGAADLAQASTLTIADTVNRLPQLQASTNSRTGNLSQGLTGINALNLRGLGSNRNLVLIDGQRFAATALTGIADTNVIPAGLIKRVDIVTGGASAAYGSDALSGVINFVLDHEFKGLKIDTSSSITTYGDDPSAKFSVTFGTPFADGRGHFVAYGDFTYIDGIKGNPRPWAEKHAGFLLNPAYTDTNGLPRYIHGDQLGLATGAPGGIITSGPLRGVVFGDGGAPSLLNYGSVVSGNVMLGGDWQYTRIDDEFAVIDQRLKVANGYSRISYDILDGLSGYIQGQYSYVLGSNKQNINPFFLGNLTINAANPFLPATISQRLAAAGGTAAFGTTVQDIGPVQNRVDRRFYRISGGLDGSLKVLGTNWKWNSYYQYSATKIRIDAANNIIGSRFRQAIDAVTDPVSGAIVCADRSNGCVPFNAFGTGVNSQRAIDFVTGTTYSDQKLSQHSAAFSFSGEPFSTWAGPISLAAGAEWRREAVSGSVDPLALANAYAFANFKPTNAHYNVKEAFVETVVPLAHEMPWARSLDLNAAVRIADYSTSGSVSTWKLGVVYQPIDDLTFRVTRSRDIRAPNLGDLFAQNPRTQTNFFDPVKGSSYPVAFQIIGNPNLKPEVASTLGVGVVVTPSFIQGFGASIDLYKIKIDGAIQTLAGQSIINRCNDGNQAFCNFFDRDPNGFITFLRQSPANYLTQKESGLDVEASYALPLERLGLQSSGSLNFRVLANHVISLKTIDNGATVSGAGVNAIQGITGAVALAVPKWRITPSIVLSNDPLTFGVTMRYISPGKYLNEAIECSTNCPTSTAANPTVDTNRIPAWTVFDISTSYRVSQGLELYLNVDNVANKNPPYNISDTGNNSYGGVGISQYYDILGRVFRAGVRLKL